MSQLWAILAVVGGGIAAMLAALWKANRSGRNDVLAEQARKNDAIRSEFDKIDSQRPNVDDALDRLRKRADSGRSASSK